MSLDLSGCCQMKFLAVIASGVFAGSVSAETIVFDPGSVSMAAGASDSALIKLADNTTPLLGYSLIVDITATAGATGSVTVDLGLTNFFDSFNLITAAGASRDPDFSVIAGTGDGEAFISTNTSDLSTVMATPGVNDVLAQVFFRASADASGEFLITLGAGSALSDAARFAVPFSFEPMTIIVGDGTPIIPLPAPAALALAGLSPLAVRRRRRGTHAIR